MLAAPALLSSCRSRLAAQHFLFPESRYYPSSSLSLRSPSLRRPREFPGACEPAALHPKVPPPRGCGAMAGAAAAALRLPWLSTRGCSPAPRRTQPSLPPASPLCPLFPREQPFLRQCRLTVWVKRGEFVLRRAGRGVCPPSPAHGLLARCCPGAGGGCGVRGISWATCTQN